MAEEPTDPRIELRPLDWPPDTDQADRVIGAVMRHIAVHPRRRESVLEALAPYLRPALAAAAVLVAAAAASLVVAPDVAAEQDSPIARWAEAGHVPTNGELLAAFRGYSP
jgi:hypothetical protein